MTPEDPSENPQGLSTDPRGIPREQSEADVENFNENHKSAGLPSGPIICPLPSPDPSPGLKDMNKYLLHETVRAVASGLSTSSASQRFPSV